MTDNNKSQEMPVVDSKNPLAKSAGGLDSGLSPADAREVEQKAKEMSNPKK